MVLHAKRMFQKSRLRQIRRLYTIPASKLGARNTSTFSSYRPYPVRICQKISRGATLRTTFGCGRLYKGLISNNLRANNWIDKGLWASLLVSFPGRL